MLPFMSEHNLFQEVQEDLERQKLEALWKQYGAWIIAAAMLVILTVGGTTAYRSWKAEHEQRLTAGLMDAVQPGADSAKTIDLLQKFAAQNPATPQADFALLRAGAYAADHNNRDEAISLFDQVAKSVTADPAFRQLGDLLSVQLQMDKGDPAALSVRLQPLTEEFAPWRYSALEDQAYLALRAGDKAKARQIFTDLTQDARAPQTIAVRASDVLHSLN